MYTPSVRAIISAIKIRVKPYGNMVVFKVSSDHTNQLDFASQLWSGIQIPIGNLTNSLDRDILEVTHSPWAR